MACSGPIILSLTRNNCGKFSPFMYIHEDLGDNGTRWDDSKVPKVQNEHLLQANGVSERDRNFICVYACTSYNNMEIIKAGIYELLVNNIPENK